MYSDLDKSSMVSRASASSRRNACSSSNSPGRPIRSSKIRPRWVYLKKKKAAKTITATAAEPKADKTPIKMPFPVELPLTLMWLPLFWSHDAVWKLRSIFGNACWVFVMFRVLPNSEDCSASVRIVFEIARHWGNGEDFADLMISSVPSLIPNLSSSSSPTLVSEDNPRQNGVDQPRNPRVVSTPPPDGIQDIAESESLPPKRSSASPVQQDVQKAGKDKQREPDMQSTPSKVIKTN